MIPIHLVRDLLLTTSSVGLGAATFAYFSGMRRLAWRRRNIEVPSASPGELSPSSVSCAGAQPLGLQFAQDAGSHDGSLADPAADVLLSSTEWDRELRTACGTLLRSDPHVVSAVSVMARRNPRTAGNEELFVAYCRRLAHQLGLSADAEVDDALIHVRFSRPAAGQGA